MNKPLTEKEKIQLEMLQHVLDRMWTPDVCGISTESAERKEALQELLNNEYLKHEEPMKGNNASIVYVITSTGKSFLKELKARNN